MKIDNLRIGRKHDRRIKITDKMREDIKILRNKGLTFQKIADKMEISKRSVIFIIYPEKYEIAKEQFRNRRIDGRYYDKDKWREVMREHRNYKKQLFKNAFNPR